MSLLVRFAIFVSLVLALASQAFAASPWRPAQGLYWNPSEHGTYYHVSVGPTGYLFVAITTYRPDGAPTGLPSRARARMCPSVLCTHGFGARYRASSSGVACSSIPHFEQIVTTERCPSCTTACSDVCTSCGATPSVRLMT